MQMGWKQSRGARFLRFVERISHVAIMKANPDKKEKSSFEDEGQTEWVSLGITGVITLFTAIQFTIYFSSLWPYLLQLDPHISETFFGWINAVYSLGQAAMCPLFGYWSNRLGSARIPIIVGVITMMVGNLIYLHCDSTPFDPKWVMLVSRAVTGCGAGVISVLRAYAATASTLKDRSRAISLNMGLFAVGLTGGPAIQIIFAPLGYEGIKLIGPLRLNMYTAPAVMGVLINVACVVLVVMCFRESTVGLHKKVVMENASHSRFFALPSYDRVAILVCICSRFAQMFVITNLETIGGPLSMTMFNWNKQETVTYSSIMHGAFGFIGLVIYFIDIIFDFGKKMNHRIASICALLALVAFHLLTFPWWGLPGQITYQQEYITINGTTVLNPDPIGCRNSYEWCQEVPPINMWLYVISYVLINGPAFSIINISMNTTFSKILGPRNQGTMTGLLLLSGCIARICGPIFVSSLFQMFGPRPAWAMEIIFAGGCALLWIIFYKRMIPLRSVDSYTVGDSFKNKHGLVFKM